MKFEDYYREKSKASIEASVAVVGLRLKHGLTQKELAEKIGSKQPAIARVESAIYYPSTKFLEKIGDVFGYRLIIRYEPRTVTVDHSGIGDQTNKVPKDR